NGNPDPPGAGDRGGIAGLNCRVLTSAVFLQCCGTAGVWIPCMAKLNMKVFIYLPGFEWGFRQSFDHKNVPAVPGVYRGFAKGKLNIPAIPRPRRGRGCK
ncbi:MAG: hypothetical protein AB2693_25715, partial [Candidatus Thiodiazotropha sp.]